MAEQVDEPRRRISYSELGLPRTTNVETTLLGKQRTWHSLKKLEIFYLTISLLTLTASLALGIERLINLPKGSSDSTFALLLLWTTLISYLHVIEGVMREKPGDLLVFVVTSIVVLCYIIVNFMSKTEDKTKLARMIIGLVFAPIIVGCGLKLAYDYYDSKNLIFRTVGSNIDMQRMCEMVFIMSSLLMFDVQLGFSSYILFLDEGLLNITLREALIVSCGIVFTIIWVTIGFLAVRFENKTLVFIFLMTSVVEPSLILYNLITFQTTIVLPLRIAAYTCGIMAIIVRIASIGCMYKVMTNFGNGLGEKSRYYFPIIKY
ncbi:uncharacterized protein B4U80_10328 [Leptotrombidium deliense]|uniref:DUF7789 domain-containing protein n=1 Tax=Leptotrombidium deliense TaxID=299467 RepID=A0A443SJS7_9ACAR|nr:uncharacterized protein B4U80_10328 [Leptotrombidium deliense]